MAAARTKNAPDRSPSVTPLIVSAALVLGALALYFKMPGVTVAWLLITLAAWCAPAVSFTGKRDSTGRETPAHDGERAAMNRFLFWRDLRWRLLVPNADWLPGWPVSQLRAAYFSAASARVVNVYRRGRDGIENLVRRDGVTKRTEPVQRHDDRSDGFFKHTLGSWLLAVWVAAAVYTLPHHGVTFSPTLFDIALPDIAVFNILDAAAAFILITQLCGSRRRTLVAGLPCPGVRFDALPKALTWPTVTGAFLLAGIGATAGWYVSTTWMLLGAAAGVGAAITYNWRSIALGPWRELVEARDEWAPRWEMLKHDPAPQLSGRTRIGPAIVDTFTAPPATGAMAYWTLGPKLSPTLGAGTRVAVLSTPNIDPSGQPIAGSRHPLTFQVVQWPTDSIPDATSLETAPEVMALFFQCAFVWVCDELGYARPIVEQVVPICVGPVTTSPPETLPAQPEAEPEPVWTDDGSLYVPDLEPDLEPELLDGAGDSDDEPALVGGTTQVWASTLLLPDGPPMQYVRSALAGPLSGQLGCEVLVDHRNSVVYFGAATAETSVLDPQHGVTDKQLRDLAVEDIWNGRWAEVMKQGVNPPTIEHSTYAEARLSRGQLVHRQAFVTRQGVDPMEFFGLEAKIAATLNAAPFVAVSGWSSRGRVGERHPQAFTVYWSADAVPANPDTLAPCTSDAAQWVLSGRINEAFKAARLAKPEVYEARCLTVARSRGHIWKMSLRLYGGVTLSDVRGAAQRIRQHLGSEWLRVEAVEDGCVLVAGVTPARARLANPNKDAAYLASLDWEQAWLDSKVSGVGGLTPRLVSVSALPHNKKVQVLDFELPSGLALADIKAATAKLGTATGNSFVEVRTTDRSNVARLLVCEVNPLPESAGFGFAAVDASTGIPFATGVEGEPVVFDPKDSPHALLAGVTGSGKSVLGQGFLYGFAAKRADIYVIDPVKGGADFRFVAPYAKAFATTAFEAAGVLKHIYAEVVARKDANAAAGVGSYLDLETPPPPIVVMIDEFTSLMGLATVPKPSDDPTMDAERELIVAENQARTEIGVYAGKLAREARSAGVTLLLGTQKLSAKMLDSIPGAGDLKDLTLDTLIPVPVSERFPTGWARNDALEIGDLIYTASGKTTSIVKFSEVFTDNDVYEVTFDDGQTIKAGAGHLWQVSTEHGRKRGAGQPSGGRIAERLDHALMMAAGYPGDHLSTVEELMELTGYTSLGSVSRIIAHGNLTRFVRDESTGEVTPYHRYSNRGEHRYLTAGFFASLASYLDERVAIDPATGKAATGETILTTADMAAAVRSARGANNFAIRLADPVEGPDLDLPVDPYVLGAWLGDGSTGTGLFVSSASASCTDENGLSDQAHLIEQLNRAGYDGHRLACHENLVGTRGLKVRLREAGVLNAKRIPARYLRASAAQRLALLQGLMDTDGSAHRTAGRCAIYQTNKALAADVLELARSLGIKAHAAEQETFYTSKDGTRTYTGTALRITFVTGLSVFRLPRKAARQATPPPGGASQRRYITSIAKIESEPTRCIAVADESHLFLAGGFIPTHNTNLARTLLGSASSGDRMSALRNFDDIPKLGDSIPKGRGLWEPLTSSAVAIQVWFAPQADLAAELSKRVTPLDPAEQLDVSVFTGPDVAAPGPSRSPARPQRGEQYVEERDDDQVVVELEEFELSLDDLDLDDLDMDEADAGDIAEATGIDLAELGADWPAAPEHSFTGEILESGDLADLNLDEDDIDIDIEDATDPDDFEPMPTRTIAPSMSSATSGWSPSALADPFAEDAPAPPARKVPAPRVKAFRAAAAGEDPEGLVPFTDDDFGPTVASVARWNVLKVAETDLSDYAPAESQYGWVMVDAVAAYLASHPSVAVVDWESPELDELDEMGVPFRDIVADLAIQHGARLGVPRPATKPHDDDPF